MRIIPRRTRVKLELFKGYGMLDVGVGIVGMGLGILLFTSNLPGKVFLALAVAVIFAGFLCTLEDEKAYVILFHAIKYITNHKRYIKKDKDSKIRKPGVGDITPFTGIKDSYIEYGGEYYAKVVGIFAIEFRFISGYRQSLIIDKHLGAILRGVSGSTSASLVKLDRPVIYDSFIKEEEAKIERLNQAYENGLFTKAELETRLGIVRDRLKYIETINKEKKVYQPYYYLLFFDKNKNIVNELARQTVSSLSAVDMESYILNDKQLAVFLKYNYTVHFDEREIDAVDPKDYMDWILPDDIQLTSRTVKYDGLVTHNFRVTNYPVTVNNAWGHRLFNIPETRVVMKFKPVERSRAVNQIDRAINELRGQESETGKTSRVIEISQHIDTLANLLSLLQSDNESLFDTNVYVTVYDYQMSNYLQDSVQAAKMGKKIPKPELTAKKYIRRQLSEQGLRVSDMLTQQFEAYASSMISAYDAFSSKSYGIPSGSVAAVFPFVYKLLSDEGGFNLGMGNGAPIFLNFFKRDKWRVNSNMVIIGKSGSGKSYSTKTLLSNLAAENCKIFILDPENEYNVLAANLNGKLIDVGSATQGRLNPFHIVTSADDEEGEDTGTVGNISFNTHLQFLEEFFRQILVGLPNDTFEYLNNLLVELYRHKNISSESDLSKLKPSDYPVFDDLYDLILEKYQSVSLEFSKDHLRVLLNYISKFASGGRISALWNGEATISTNENFIVFNFQSLLANKNSTLANAQMLLVLKWLDNEIIKNRDYNIKFGATRKIIVAIDEAHVFIDEKHPIALDFMYQLAKRIRKYNGMQIIITQNIKDFVGTEELARKSTAIINACQYSFIFALAPNDMHDLVRLYEKAGAINENEQEEIVMNSLGRAFVVTSPNDRTSIAIRASEKIKEMFTE